MRHVLVTGAAGGIGRAIATRFAAQGATLTLADRAVPSIPCPRSGVAILPVLLSGPRTPEGGGPLRTGESEEGPQDGD
ncbi:SDR family NAD(P)-dependent oxidoreductase, partial [Streptomyces sp. McG5]|uniref:SDR family NAD(P)-dependent oxidoreductase n=1 Tax=Streptomyces sp. McG5 TaxID=2725484 RepID=UPI002036B3E8